MDERNHVESANPNYTEKVWKAFTEPADTPDDDLDARINMTDPATDAMIEIDPWTQRWEQIAEKEKQSKKAPL